MVVHQDFDLRIPERALRIAITELLPLFREHLLNHGIADPSNYDHYEIRIVVEPRRIKMKEDGHPSFFNRFKPVSRKQKKLSFAAADSIFITREPSDSDIELREAFPPTTDEEGSFVRHHRADAGAAELCGLWSDTSGSEYQTMIRLLKRTRATHESLLQMRQPNPALQASCGRTWFMGRPRADAGA